MKRTILLIAFFWLTFCAHTTRQHDLAAAKRAILSADYRADLAELKKQRAAVAAYDNYLAHYWAGFASWRLAMNGANQGMPQAEMQAAVEDARAEFETSIKLRDDFADSYSAASAVTGWLISFNQKDPAKVRELATRARALLKRAKELGPDNPRVLWVEGGMLFGTPKQFGGDQQKAMEVYRHAVTVVETERVTDPAKPDWGKPEIQMALAYCHLNQEKPDVESARAEAKRALEMEPDWVYVRDVLLPQIEKKR